MQELQPAWKGRRGNVLLSFGHSAGPIDRGPIIRSNPELLSCKVHSGQYGDIEILHSVLAPSRYNNRPVSYRQRLFKEPQSDETHEEGIARLFSQLAASQFSHGWWYSITHYARENIRNSLLTSS
jgi:hypothetical protein